MLLWLLLTGSADPQEVLVGMGISTLAATSAELVRARVATGFRPRLRWFAAAWRIPIRVVTDTAAVFAALLRHVTGRKRVRGRFHAVPFVYGEAEDPRAGARRALAIVGVSMMPNTLVIGIDADRDVMLVHRLVPDPEAFETFLRRP